MEQLKRDLSNLNEALPDRLSEEQRARAKTLFLKKLSLEAHRFYGGKIQTLPRAGLYGFNWFNVWYTPGVSAVSTTIRDDNETSFDLSGRGNLVAVVSDSTRVLGDGDCTPPGGLGVMEGKAYLMKYLGGVDATALCMNSTNEKGEKDPDKIIDFVKMLEPSFGAVNLEDISQPNCYKVLDTLREETEIPVWHDDAQGTAGVTLAGLINALKLADKEIGKVRIVMMGAGASNATIARIILEAGGDPEKMVLFDSKGSLHAGRSDIESDPRFYRKWELCRKTNPQRFGSFEEAVRGADVLLALSKPGPGVIKPEWVSSMAEKAIVFSCANPVPEIYPYAAKEAGAFIVATGRGDFPNQVNNSLGFPGILKGALGVRSRKITDQMTIAASYALADYARERGISPDSIVPTMEETPVFPRVAADVAAQAVKEGVARIDSSRDVIYDWAQHDIDQARAMTRNLMDAGFIAEPPRQLMEQALSAALKEVEG
ncbi:MAG: NADP-dependent malic enzyme [Spirochaetales bacterium]|nr:NADP-dependent malic enzyme [Spirochaetales bacterium]MCF7938900.1 NADP-dependent malic enzyme [Spirochaetales bacterium]